jgi:BASS family bile acid:Na+ symporter
MLVGIFLNYIVFGSIILLLAWLLMPTSELFYGFVVIVAAPPGVAIIPFSYMLKGKVDYAIISVTGGFLASVVLAPFIVEIFAKSKGIQPFDLFLTMVQMVVIPMVLAQLLRWKKVFPFIQKVRGKVVDWGFALLIFVAVGVNRTVFFTNPSILLLVFITVIVGVFGLGIGYEFIARKLRVEKSLVVTQSMLVAIKSSGFSVFTALALFGQEAAIPSAILAIVVLVYLIYLSLRSNLKG